MPTTAGSTSTSRANPSALRAIPRAADRQGGVFLAAQARAEGWPDRVIRRRISAGRWVYVAGRALAEPRECWTAFRLGTAAQLSLSHAVVSHRTAALLHGFPLPVDQEQVCDVTMAVRRRGGHAIKVHLLRLAPEEIKLSGSRLRITSASRTAIDCLAGLPFAMALDLWAWLSTRAVLDGEQLSEAIALRRRWYGTAQLRRIHELTSTGAVSSAEVTFHQILRQAGFTGWQANIPIMDGDRVIAVADVAFPARGLIIEIDGFRAHSSHAQFLADRRRQNRLVSAGYTVLRFTWEDLTERQDEVIAQLTQALAAAARSRLN